MEIAFKSHIKIVTILYLSILSAQIFPLCVTRWHCKNIHCTCSPSAFIATNSAKPRYASSKPWQSLIKIHLRGFPWQLSVVPGHRPLRTPLSLHGVSARAGVHRPAPTSQHTLQGAEPGWPAHNTEGNRRECTRSPDEIQSSQLQEREQAWHIIPHFLGVGRLLWRGNLLVCLMK